MLEELRNIRLGISTKPDLVILDFMLADNSGTEVLKAIKKTSSYPRYPRICRY